MEDIYYFNNDCINELSKIIIDNKLLFSLSYSCEAVRNCFHFRDHFEINKNHTDQHISKYTHVKKLNVGFLTRFIDLISFKYLENLTFHGLGKELNIYDGSRLTYLDDVRCKVNIDFQKYFNLKYLRCCYAKEIENLIYLQSLRCIISTETSMFLDFSLLSNLIVFDLTNHNKKCRTVILSPNIKLIKLSCSKTNFLNVCMIGDKLTWLDLYKSENISFYNLREIQIINIYKVKNVNIRDCENSFEYLTEMDTDNTASFVFHNAINLKILDIRNCNSSIDMSFLTSLETLWLTHNTEYNINLIHLTNLTYLHFKNSREVVSNIILPTNLVNFCFKHSNRIYRNNMFETNTQIHNILKQIQYMPHLQTLHLTNISTSDTITQTSLTKLKLFQSGYNFHCLNLKHLIFRKMNMSDVNTKYLSHLKKLTLEELNTFTIQDLKELKSLENLKLVNTGNNVKFDNIDTLTHLVLVMHSGNIEIKKLTNLKSLTINNNGLFLKLCEYGFPSSVKDIYLMDNKFIDNTLLKNINLHFVR